MKNEKCAKTEVSKYKKPKTLGFNDSFHNQSNKSVIMINLRQISFLSCTYSIVHICIVNELYQIISIYFALTVSY